MFKSSLSHIFGSCSIFFGYHLYYMKDKMKTKKVPKGCKVWFTRNWTKLCSDNLLDAEDHRKAQCEYVWRVVLEDEFLSSYFEKWYTCVHLEGLSLKDQTVAAWVAALIFKKKKVTDNEEEAD